MTQPQLNTTHLGDALAVLRTWPDDFVDCCVTSPPYMALRSYLPADDPLKAMEMGSEPTIAEFIANLIAVLREVRRVLKPSGTCWVNIGDSYAGSGRGANPNGKQGTNKGTLYDPATPHYGPEGVPAKNLMLIPERFALAAQLDGWIVRDRIPWVKGREYDDGDVGLNPMPGSQKDRCTTAWEHIYMLTKRASGYYFDWQAIAEPPRQSSIARLGQDVDAQAGSTRANGGAKTNGPMKALKPAVFGGVNKHVGLAEQGNRLHSGKEWDPYHGSRFDTGKTATHQLGRAQEGERERQPLVMPRNVWIFPSRGYKGAHYATFPPELPRRCIQLSCPPDGLVLAPFMGSGTTAAVAEELGRSWIGIDLDARNLALIEQRLAEVRARQPQPAAPTLFDPVVL